MVRTSELSRPVLRVGSRNARVFMVVPGVGTELSWAGWQADARPPRREFVTYGPCPGAGAS